MLIRSAFCLLGRTNSRLNFETNRRFISLSYRLNNHNVKSEIISNNYESEIYKNSAINNDLLKNEHIISPSVSDEDIRILGEFQGNPAAFYSQDGYLTSIFNGLTKLFHLPFDAGCNLYTCLIFQIIPLFILNLNLKYIYGYFRYNQLSSLKKLSDHIDYLKNKAKSESVYVGGGRDFFANMAPSANKFGINEIGVIMSRVFPFWLMRGVVNSLDPATVKPLGILWIPNVLEYDHYYILPIIYTALLLSLFIKHLKNKLAPILVSIFIFFLMSKQSALFLFMTIMHGISLVAVGRLLNHPQVYKYTKFHINQLEKNIADIKISLKNSAKVMNEANNAVGFNLAKELHANKLRGKQEKKFFTRPPTHSD